MVKAPARFIAVEMFINGLINNLQPDATQGDPCALS